MVFDDWRFIPASLCFGIGTDSTMPFCTLIDHAFLLIFGFGRLCIFPLPWSFSLFIAMELSSDSSWRDGLATFVPLSTSCQTSTFGTFHSLRSPASLQLIRLLFPRCFPFLRPSDSNYWSRFELDGISSLLSCRVLPLSSTSTAKTPFHSLSEVHLVPPFRRLCFGFLMVDESLSLESAPYRWCWITFKTSETVSPVSEVAFRSDGSLTFAVYDAHGLRIGTRVGSFLWLPLQR